MSESPIKVVINKQINGSVEKVYQAWTDPQLLKQWFGPDPSMTVPDAQVDLNVGGDYLIHMRAPESESDHIVSGTYEEIVPDRKLVFNWKWQDGVERTQVTVDFHAQGENKTLLTLTHRGFSQQEYADKHNQGWTGCLSCLSGYFN